MAGDRGAREQELADMRKPRPDAVRWRPCLSCGDRFPSEGAHNRMCNPCRSATRHADPGLPAARVAR
ncbi:MAG: hypothetical protein VYD87_17185 [Pseudomonadota bacterium]|nr:hypothetical protein [Pseudomonadota bacterium]